MKPLWTFRLGAGLLLLAAFAAFYAQRRTATILSRPASRRQDPVMASFPPPCVPSLADWRADRPDYDRMCAGLNRETLSVYLEWVATVAAEARVDDLVSLLRVVTARWLEFDREGALGFALGLPRDIRGSVLENLVARLAAEDRQAAWDFALAQAAADTAGLPMNLAGVVLRAAGRSDPGWALERLAALAPGPVAEDLTGLFFMSQTSWSLAEAGAWIKRLPAVEMQDRAWLALLQAAAPENPRQALDALTQEPSPSAEWKQQATRLATIWAGTDPAAAFAWAESARPELFPALSSTIIGVWTRSDAGAAAGWLQPRLGDPRYADALRDYAVIKAYREPAQTRQWAQTIVSPESRRIVLTELNRLGR